MQTDPKLNSKLILELFGKQGNKWNIDDTINTSFQQQFRLKQPFFQWVLQFSFINLLFNRDHS